MHVTPRARWFLAGAAVLVLVCAVAVAGLAWTLGEDGCSPPDPSTPAAAIVNCELIGEATVQFGLKPLKTSNPELTRDEYLSILIDEELLFQEGKERGFMPTAAEVDEAIASSRELTNWSELVAVLERFAEPVPSEEEYWSSPNLHRSMSRTMTVTAYREHVETTYRGDIGFDHAIQQEIDRLRAKADIEIFEP